jgi:hypothetical protein
MPINVNGNELNSVGGRILTNTEIPTSSLSYYYDAALIDSYPGSGTTVTNFVGSVNGNLQNGVGYSTNGGGSWVFDGSNDRMLLDNSNYSILLYNGNVDWTVHSWMKTTSTTDGLSVNPILSNTNGGPIYGSLDVNGGRQAYWAYPSNIGTWKQFKGNITVNDGNWHLLTWVNNSNYTMNFYVDGVYDTQISPVNVANNNPMDVIGGGLGSSFPGSIALVSVYYTSHPLSQVLQFFNSTRQRFEI